MPRYIDADDIKNAIEGVTRNYLSTLSTTDTIDSVTAKWLYKRLKTLVDEMPTADVVERKNGKWVTVKIGNGDTRYTCSECGASYECDSRDRWDFNFCPNCGAEMSERRGENE